MSQGDKMRQGVAAREIRQGVVRGKQTRAKYENQRRMLETKVEEKRGREQTVGENE